MHRNQVFIFALALALALAGSASPSSAATFTGTVTNKTFNKPSAGDAVELVDVQAGMTDVASATTNAAGQYSVSGPGVGPYLIRISHQGATYFIAAPQGGANGDVTVYDVAAKVEGVGIDADMLLIEAGGGILRVQERYMVRNTSLPPRAQFSTNTFEVVIPPDAEVDGAAVTRPGGLGTNTHLTPLAEKGHYTFNIPIQPNQGEKETLFEVQYHLPYSGKYTFTPTVQMPSDHLVVYLAKGIDFSNAQGASFEVTQEDPRVQTFVARGVNPGQSIRFTVAGEGQMARDTSSTPMEQQAGVGDSGTSGIAGRPGGGIGAPINSPDPLTKYKWWILIGLTFVLIAAAAYFVRKRDRITFDHSVPTPEPMRPGPPAPKQFITSGAVSPPSPRIPIGNKTLLDMIKDELFAIESEKLTGTISAEEYGQIKAGLGALLKRELEKHA